MLPEKEVAKIAKLARLGLEKKELKKFQTELSSILDYIEKIEKLDVAQIKPTSHPLELENIKRKDESLVSKSKNLLDLAPETKEGYLKVRSILK
jgi:aspartyl-tRNA(Asn)/glutamyl-tRNA(Gln) amidotransferase subunit C